MKTIKKYREVYKTLVLNSGNTIKAKVLEEYEVPAYEVINYSREYKQEGVMIEKSSYLSEYKPENVLYDEKYIENLFNECIRFEKNLKERLSSYEKEIIRLKDLLNENERDMNNLKEGRYTIIEKK